MDFAIKLKEFAEDNFKWDENGRKSYKRVENNVEKGESRLRAISPFPTVFSKGLYCRHVKTRACLGKGLTSQKLFFFFKFGKSRRKIPRKFFRMVHEWGPGSSWIVEGLYCCTYPGNFQDITLKSYLTTKFQAGPN